MRQRPRPTIEIIRLPIVGPARERALRFVAKLRQEADSRQSTQQDSTTVQAAAGS